MASISDKLAIKQVWTSVSISTLFGESGAWWRETDILELSEATQTID